MRAIAALLGSLALVFCATQALSQPAPSGAAPPAAPSATAPQPAAASPASPAKQPAPAPVPMRARQSVPKPPDPTAEQLAALAELQREAEQYEADARDYHRTMTRIIRHHYEEKRRRVLSALDVEIASESKSLRDAREEAIRRLEAFIAKYSGPNAHPDNTPDAMFRLAALYEERARDAAQQQGFQPGMPPPEADLGPAIALYKRIVREFPRYGEIAGVFYYLGHAFNDTGRLEEAQQVWRSLVCHNRFPYPVPADPDDPTRDSIQRLPQDHDPGWWLGWLSRHPEPLDKVRERKAAEALARTTPRRDAEPAEPVDDEEVFKNPYPADCQALAQPTEPGEPPRYVAELWWRIGDYHFDEIDPWGGPYNLNRAEAAYRHAMKIERPPVYDVSMYKLAWTYFKQQRYRTAVRQFIDLLHLTEKRERETGNPGADFRKEAVAYIAGSLTYLDFDGPGQQDPYMARNDVFDLYTESAEIEQAMRVALERVQDPSLVPQDQRWTVDIYGALAFEFKEYNQLHNLVEISELILAKWPLHRDAPFVQNQIANVYEQLASQSKGAEAERYSEKALAARGRLADYVEQPGHVPEWVKANEDDPEAVRAAETLVRGGLRRAAADHTNLARRYIQLARSAADPEERDANYQRALREYRLASRAWGGYLLQDENAEDAYDSRYWLADAYTNVVVIKAQLGEVATDQEIAMAQAMARAVRDSNEDDKYLQPAAIMVVRVAQQVVAVNYRLYDEGRGGFPQVDEVRTVQYQENGETKLRPARDDIPRPVQELITAFDEYVATVPIDADTYGNHDLFAYQAGEIPFLYGHFDEAKRRLTPIYIAQCGTSKYGFEAWMKLVTMAALENDFDRSRELAEADTKKSCALADDPTAQARADQLRGDILDAAFYKDAYDAFKAANDMREDTPERRKLYEKAAKLYEEALRSAPARDEAPEAAINGAICYKQIGNYDKAIAMYELFIGEYGTDEQFDKVKNDKAKYDERVDFLKKAYDALGEAYVLFFDYRRAAQTYDKVSNINRFSASDRRDAAQNAVYLYLNLGERDKLEATKQRFFALNPPKEQQAELEWLIAQADLAGWDERAPDRGDNQRARLKATTTTEAFYTKWSRDPAAAGFSLQAAYQTARLKRAGAEPSAEWCRRTIAAFDTFQANAPRDPESGRSRALGSLQAEMAAECEYRAIDAELKKSFDYDAGHHRYTGDIVSVQQAFKRDVEVEAKAYYDRLQVVIEKYGAMRWSVAARMRQGSLFDSCRTGLFNAREPGLQLFTTEEQALPACKILNRPRCSEVQLVAELDKLCVDTGSETACTAYDTMTANRRTVWRNQRDGLLAGADQAMVAGYADAILWARAARVRVREVDEAIRRMAFYTDIIGDAKLRQYTGIVKDPGTKQAFQYQDGMFLRMRRGLTPELPSEVNAAPLPANPR